MYSFKPTRIHKCSKDDVFKKELLPSQNDTCGGIIIGRPLRKHKKAFSINVQPLTPNKIQHTLSNCECLQCVNLMLEQFMSKTKQMLKEQDIITWEILDDIDFELDTSILKNWSVSLRVFGVENPLCEKDGLFVENSHISASCWFKNEQSYKAKFENKTLSQDTRCWTLLYGDKCNETKELQNLTTHMIYDWICQFLDEIDYLEDTTIDQIDLNNETGEITFYLGS